MKPTETSTTTRLLTQTVCLRKKAVDAEGLDELQELGALDFQHLGGGGAVAQGLAENLAYRLALARSSGRILRLADPDV